MGELNFCLLSDILHAVSNQLARDIAADTGIPFWLIRLSHNKPAYVWFNFLHCYFLYLDIRQFLTFLPLITLPLVTYALFTKPWRKLLWMIQLLLPLFFILNPLHFDLGARIHLFEGYYAVLAVTGLIKFLRRKKLC